MGIHLVSPFSFLHPRKRIDFKVETLRSACVFSLFGLHFFAFFKKRKINLTSMARAG